MKIFHPHLLPAFVATFCALLLTQPAWAASLLPLAVDTRAAVIKLGFEQITLPENERMGLMGTSYLIETTPDFYVGLSAYSALTGRRGGFYTAGAEFTWRYALSPNVSLESGVFLGGGGGGPNLVGGGWMLRPHADLLWGSSNSRAGLSLSSVQFPNGHIRSQQLGLLAEIDTDFKFMDFDQHGQERALATRSGVGFDRLLFTTTTYHPSKTSTTWGGVPLQQTIGLVGARMEHMITPHYYWGLETAGAISGGVPGYAELLGTLGMERPTGDERLRVGARLAAGTGGGGYVTHVGGGGLLKAGVYASATLAAALHLNLEAGYTHAPTGNFSARYQAVALNMDLDRPFQTDSTSRITGHEWQIGSQHYFNALRLNGQHQGMNVLTFKMNRFIADTFYLSGQAHTAYNGEAGGYAVGLVGAGLRTSPNSWGMTAGAELLIGAGAGGWVDSRGGAVAQALLYTTLPLTQDLSLRLSAGRIKALQGGLDSPLLELGLSFAFASSSRGAQ